MFHDILESSWSYEEMVQNGIEKGFAKAFENNMKLGELKASRSFLIRIVEKHFPELLSLAQRRAAQLNMDILDTMIDKLLNAQTTEEAKVILTYQDEFIQFLLNAKQHTYATQGDNATVTPSLPGSRQLEYQTGQYLYRDIYFGNAYFVGQETIYDHDQPTWAMSYAGGIIPTSTSPKDVTAIYTFLRSALLLIAPDRPYRGPQSYNDNTYVYIDESWGNIDRFHGHEVITQAEICVYELYYNGGFLL